MNVILLMIPISLVLSLGFVLAFIWSAKKGQFDHIDLEAHRILDEDDLNKNKTQVTRKDSHDKRD